MTIRTYLWVILHLLVFVHDQYYAEHFRFYLFKIMYTFDFSQWEELQRNQLSGFPSVGTASQ